MIDRRVLMLAVAAALVAACGDSSPGNNPRDGGVMQVIACPSNATTCDRLTQICCATGTGATATFACVPWSGGCNGGCTEQTTPIKCDGNEDCAVLGGVCCGRSCGGAGVTTFDFIQCVPTGTCDPALGEHQVCASTNLAQCGCSNPQPSSALSGYSFCP